MRIACLLRRDKDRYLERNEQPEGSAANEHVVNLDTVANTWMRAPGESIGTFALESAIDELAHALRLDPIALRRLNEPTTDPTKQ